VIACRTLHGPAKFLIRKSFVLPHKDQKSVKRLQIPQAGDPGAVEMAALGTSEDAIPEIEGVP